MNRRADLDEQQLIELARNGQSEAYGELVQQHQTRVYNLIYRMTGDRQEAFDLAQEAFVRGYTALAGFERGRLFGPWIGRVAVNLTLNWLQRRRTPTVSLVDREDNEPPYGARPPPDYGTEPERLYLAGERRTRIRAALAELPPHYRAVVELRHFQDLSYEEIAEWLAIPLSDVKSHLFRARRLLRHRLEDEQ